ncbi:MAG TPA: hypothetical protein VKZ43_04470 [Trueperaceae bacterium]|nr:hypothetical protein [Trueperaceae bacterium]
MIGFTNSVMSTFNDRAEHLREVAAHEALVRAERRAAKAAARHEAALKAAREQQQALFSWESQGHRQRDARRQISIRLLGRTR